MCNWRKWIWPGILATVLLTALAMLMKSGSIQQDLQARCLGDNNWASISADGRDLMLTGTAPSEEARDNAIRSAEECYGTRVAAANIDLLPLQDPFNLSAAKSDGKVTLNGFVPDEETRTEVVSAATALEAGDVVDNLKLARGAPAGFGALAGFGISQLKGLKAGEASLSALDLSVKGEAADFDTYDGVTGMLAGELPYGGKLAMSDIVPPVADPYTFSAAKTGEGISLSGFVPSMDAKTQIEAQAKAENPAVNITNNLRIARGAPEGFGALAGFGLSQLPRFTAGEVSVNNNDLAVKGMAADSDAYDAAMAALASNLPAGAKLAMDDITPPAISPYTFSADEDENGVVLNGYIPDEAARAPLVEAAGKVTKGAVTDNLKIGSGAPDGFPGLANFGIAQLGQLSSGKVSLSGANLTVRGTAISPAAYDRVLADLSGDIPAGGSVAVADITRNTISPYTFSAERRDGVIVLDGYVNNTDIRESAVSYAKTLSPGSRIVDRLAIANGVPKGIDWSAATQLAIKEASQLSEGTASIRNGDYTIEGMASTNRDFEDLKSETGTALAGGLKLASEKIRRPVIKDYVWSFTNMEGQDPELSGYVPDDSVSTDNGAQVLAALGTSRKLGNTLEIGAGAPRNFAAATSVGISSVSRLIDGKASIDGTTLTVEGEALSDFAANQVRQQVENGVPPGFKGVHNISVREVRQDAIVNPDICQQLLRDELKHNAIRFQTNEAIIDAVSHGLLDRLSFVVKRCPTATVEISGHTDSDGSEDYNQTLSERRANAVRSYLVHTGIFVGRLKASGYGESRPVADNATEQGKAQNRRIEFTVVR